MAGSEDLAAPAQGQDDSGCRKDAREPAADADLEALQLPVAAGVVPLVAVEAQAQRPAILEQVVERAVVADLPVDDAPGMRLFERPARMAHVRRGEPAS